MLCLFWKTKINHALFFPPVLSKFFNISGDMPEMKPSTRLDKPLQLCSFITEDE